MFVRAAFLVSLILMPLTAVADGWLPDRRLVITRDQDFAGRDIQQIFDTTYQACRNACQADANCVAFTFNTRSNACFPKSMLDGMTPYAGAISAEVFNYSSSVITEAEARGARLDFLSERDQSAALAETLDLAERHPAGISNVPELLQGAGDARARGDLAAALRFTGAALAQSDAPDLWAEYARLQLDQPTENRSKRFTLNRRAQAAAINAYLRAPTEPMQANALMTLAEALEAGDRGRDSLSALRLAEEIQPRADIAEALDAAIAKYGFRVTETRVDSDSAAPRLCAEFSEVLVQAGVDYAPFVAGEIDGLAVQAEGRQICLDGVNHGSRYRVTFRAGLPAASGEELIKPVQLSLYVRDRAPAVRFPGRSYVLPASGPAAVPVVTVNASEVDLTLFRVSDRNLVRSVQNDLFARQIVQWEQRLFAGEIAEEVWSGSGATGNELNRDMTTRLPISDITGALEPGIYVLQAAIPKSDPYDSPAASQWFVVSDLGLSTMNGVDGLHAFVRLLATAEAKPGATVTLLSRANAVLGTAETDAQGYARFAPALSAGKGGAVPAMLTVEGGDDLAFLPLTDPEFDLSDRGVEGRDPAGPIDVFLATDRGAYRAGEVINLTALARDGQAEAVSGLPLTAILKRPDGVEFSRHLSAVGHAGGHVFDLPTTATAPRGVWRVDVKGDVDAAALATTTVLVEDFLPERIDFDLALPDVPLRATDEPPLSVSARYLFGAPGADLAVEGFVRLGPVRELPDYPGYVFGRYDERANSQLQYFDQVRTNAAGNAVMPVVFPDVEAAGRPLDARLTVAVSEGSGRPVEREISTLIRPETPLIGIRPLFDGTLSEGSEAVFSLIALAPDDATQALPVRWTLDRVERRYQWYSLYGNWEWEPITTRTRIATGELVLGGDPMQVSAPVDWGNYELRVEALAGPYVASSTDFWAGWYAAADASATPDTAEVSLDAAAYRPGETAILRVVPRFAGTALVTVVSNRLIDMKTVSVTEGENLIALPVTDDWGAGAYVTATVIRPLGAADDPSPARSLGLAYAPVDPGAHNLDAAFEVSETADPRGPLEVALRVDGVAEGETAWATIAAVDLGILNLTGHETPDPAGHYFGQRKLGVGIRDLYGRLIDGSSGAMGTVRSGGDAAGNQRLQAPPPEDLVAYFSGPVQVGTDGLAHASFDLPSFNGTLRLMAVVWSPTGVASAEAEVLVRDPIVVTASLPRFMSPGDSARMLLEVVHASGPEGDVGLTLGASGVFLETDSIPAQFQMTEGSTTRLLVPVTAGAEGLADINVTLTTPDGKTLTKPLVLPIRRLDPEVTRRSRFALAAGDTFRFDREVFTGFAPGSGSATLAAGPIARLDAPGLLAALDRYPYGCTEQITSRALPLLYLNEVATAMGLVGRNQLSTRIEQAVAEVLSNQASNGAFGLWRPASGDFWLDAYVTDFLSRARNRGFDVPQVAFTTALDNLRNRINFAPDFDRGGEDIAYALYVLAREGAAAIGDLRYYADEKATALATPLAKAQLGAALAAYGDPTRADTLFAAAASDLTRPPETEARYWRSDYGTHLRDSAAVLTLAVEAGSNAVNRDRLADAIAPLQGGHARSTQEATWSLLAAHALVEDASGGGLSIDGAPPDGPLVRLLEDATDAGAIQITNTGARETILTLTTFGVPEQPEPKGGNGYAIGRMYMTLDGVPVNPSSVVSGTRLVTVLTVQPFGGGEARLMVNDPLPAGFEIDNPNLLRSGDIAALEFVEVLNDTETTEFREDRFLAAVDWRSNDRFQLAYLVRAITPGDYHHPAASVEDMYRPEFRAHTDAGRITVTQ